ncbi:hypothetical protein [Bdellovibrio sp. HCB2-146]|uniref:hypothetical protein n=1 Tax=Bdellovibrio sp. HCB2-146 TaxID=3394362 RepID=UPI0039BCF57F
MAKNHYLDDSRQLLGYYLFMDKRLEKYFDENLRDNPKDPEGLRNFSIELEQSLKLTTDPLQRIRFLGELGVHLRTLGDLDRAEQCLRDALKIIQENNLGIKWEIQQKIRLAHVLQWKRSFNESDSLFSEIINTCRSNVDATIYLDFALQHAGKNFFDQNRLREALAFFEETMSLRLKRKAPQDQIESTDLAIKRTKSLLAY